MRDKIKIKEAIIVEGKYDKNTLSQLVDTLIITTDGFQIFKQPDTIGLLRTLAKERGLIILTDSDGAGFVIRNHLKGVLSSENIKQCYIPDIYGKEKRKDKPSKEGKLGVEGMKPDILLKALQDCGATIINNSNKSSNNNLKLSSQAVTKADFYTLGLTGGSNSLLLRKTLIKRLNLPEHLSTNELIKIINSIMTKEDFNKIICEIRR